MARPSPLLKKRADAISACGKILHSGQSIIVSESAIGPRERVMEDKGRLSIRPANEKGKVQVICTL